MHTGLVSMLAEAGGAWQCEDPVGNAGNASRPLFLPLSLFLRRWRRRRKEAGEEEKYLGLNCFNEVKTTQIRHYRYLRAYGLLKSKTYLLWQLITGLLHCKVYPKVCYLPMC